MKQSVILSVTKWSRRISIYFALFLVACSGDGSSTGANGGSGHDSGNSGGSEYDD